MEPLIFVPIERLKERYSDQWFTWFADGFKRAGIVPFVAGDTGQKQIVVGQFLDVMDTCEYKTKQMAEIISLVRAGFEGTVFFMDLWFPGVEHLAYIRDNAKKRIKIAGILHAGTWDSHDFLSQNGCGKWAKHTERGWITLCDRVYVATEYHKKLICKGLNICAEEKICVTEFPCYRSAGTVPSHKQNLVVFPHRIAPEKQPDVFRHVEDIYRRKYNDTDTPFVRSKDVCKDKDEYYQLLESAKVCFSSALQETFGIAMLEGVACGCIPVAPDRLSYQETLREFPRYNTLSEAADLIHKALHEYKRPEVRHWDNVDAIIREIKAAL